MSFHEYIFSNKVQVCRGWIADIHQWRHAMGDDNANLCDPAITQMTHTMETFLLEYVLFGIILKHEIYLTHKQIKVSIFHYDQEWLYNVMAVHNWYSQKPITS